MTLTIVRKHHESGLYKSKYFDYQRADRLVVRIESDGSLVEVTAYAHTRKSTLIDVAVDLPSMVGCPVQCSFCATGKYRRRLSTSEIVNLWKLIERESDIVKPPFPVLLASFQGIGEATLNYEAVTDAAIMIRDLHPSIRLSVATTVASKFAFRHWQRMNLIFNTMQFSVTDAIQRAETTGNWENANEVAACARNVIENKTTRYSKLNILPAALTTATATLADWLAKQTQNTEVEVKISHLNPTKRLGSSGIYQSDYRTVSLLKDLQERNVKCYLYGAFRETQLSCGQLLEENDDE